ncbi:hypothetical protein FRX31_004388 [Thalictrum thalictroides]|uniref:Uncharacterized protein n=1 Tax=Thalictrum thalictroides TaxID=46969 RepID=A0A7J6XB15_THATH|nr:hypothetical protein FRX31_004388 [Thalictrum thalictroides]
MNYNLQGCALAFIIWAYSHIPCLGRREAVVPPFPRMLSWKNLPGRTTGRSTIQANISPPRGKPIVVVPPFPTEEKRNQELVNQALQNEEPKEEDVGKDGEEVKKDAKKDKEEKKDTENYEEEKKDVGKDEEEQKKDVGKDEEEQKKDAVKDEEKEKVDAGNNEEVVAADGLPRLGGKPNVLDVSMSGVQDLPVLKG